jgi:hypothetical protein
MNQFVIRAAGENAFTVNVFRPVYLLLKIYTVDIVEKKNKFHEVYNPELVDVTSELYSKV